MYHHRLLCAVLLGLLASGTALAFDGKTGYEIGDRLEQQAAAAASKGYKEISWDDLVPKGWDPMKDFKHLDYSKLKDSDPRAKAALQQLRNAWVNAPVEPSLNGKHVRLPGFVVPLEVVHHRITEFLLVPYFGGCIHTPPPPGNQIIHVFPAKPLKKGTQSMDAVWINGKLQTVPSTTDMGNASYSMKADIVEPYEVE